MVSTVENVLFGLGTLQGEVAPMMHEKIEDALSLGFVLAACVLLGEMTAHAIVKAMTKG